MSKTSFKAAYEEDYEMYLDHLQHATEILIILNISLFFVTRLVKQGYYYTFYSLFCLAFVQIMLLLPIKLVRQLWFYLCLLVVEFVGVYFFVSSVVYWVRTNA